MNAIMVATDFSARAVNASHRAALLANAVAADAIELVHVLPAPSRVGRFIRRDEDERALKLPTARINAVRDVLQNMTNAWVEARVIDGPLVEALVAASRRADLLVVGASKAMPWLRSLIGSTVTLLRRIRVPMLVVRKSPGYAYRRVLMAVDLVTAADRALAAARTIAPGARFDVVHAYRAAFEGKLQYAGVSPEIVADLRADASRDALFRIADLVASNVAPPRLTAHIVHGHAATRVLDKARELEADLIVVSKSEKTRIEELVVPGMTARLLETSSADVLVIPS